MLVLAMEEGDMIPNKSTKLFWLLVVCVCYCKVSRQTSTSSPILPFPHSAFPSSFFSSVLKTYCRVQDVS